MISKRAERAMAIVMEADKQPDIDKSALSAMLVKVLLLAREYTKNEEIVTFLQGYLIGTIDAASAPSRYQDVMVRAINGFLTDANIPLEESERLIEAMKQNNEAFWKEIAPS